MRTIYRLDCIVAVSLALALFLVGCSGNNLLTGTTEQKKAGASQSQGSVSPMDGTQLGDDDAIASEPVPVGGSFLTCRPDPNITALQGEQGVGCQVPGIFNDVFRRSPKVIQVYNAARGIVLPPASIRQEPLGSPWLFTFSSAPAEVFQHLVYLQVTVNGKVFDFQSAVTNDVEPTTDRLRLIAARSYQPQSWWDGVKVLQAPLRFTLPGEIVVTEGNAGNHTARLLIDGIICLYRGGSVMANPLASEDSEQIDLGRIYELEGCANGWTAGDTVVGSKFLLRVDSGDNTVQKTVIRLDLRLDEG